MADQRLPRRLANPPGGVKPCKAGACPTTTADTYSRSIVHTMKFPCSPKQHTRTVVFRRIVIVVAILSLMVALVMIYGAAYYPPYRGKSRFFCDKVSVPVSIATPDKQLRREYHSPDGASISGISSTRISADDTELLVYPLTYTIVAALQDGTLICPIWRANVRMEDGSVKPTFGEIRDTLRGIAPGTHIKVPSNRNIQSVTFLLNDRFRDNPRYNTQEDWYVYTIDGERLEDMYRKGVFIPEIADLKTVASSPKANELWQAYQSATIEYGEMILERGYY